MKADAEAQGSRTDSQDSDAPSRAARVGTSFPRYLLTIVGVTVGYSSYYLWNIIFAFCLVPLILLLSPFPRLKHGCLHALVHSYLAFYTRVYLPALGVYKIAEVSGTTGLGTLGPAVYVSNHRCRLDALFLLGLLKKTGVVVKAKYAAAPALAALVAHFDFVSTDSHFLSSLAATLGKCRALMARGVSLLVFPEGSRAASGRLQPFKDFAFRLAIESGRPVVPVIIHSTQPFLTRVPGSLFPKGRNVYRIRFLEPEQPMPSDTPDTLSDRVRVRMARELKQLDSGTVWETSVAEGKWKKN